MKRFDRLTVVFVLLTAAVFAAVNIFLVKTDLGEDKSYRVEINRIVKQLERGEKPDADDFEQVTQIREYDGAGDFYKADSEYVIVKASGSLWRISYEQKKTSKTGVYVSVNIGLGALTLMLLAVMLYTRRSVIRPFQKLRDYPVELSKGNLTEPLKENRSKNFGRFIWGLDMLRNKLEDDRKREYEHARKEKTMLLSLSHDIKTPLAAIKLSAQALSKGIYKDPEKQISTAKSISANADEIEKYVGEIIRKTENDFLSYEISISQFYLSQTVDHLKEYYSEKLSVLGIRFETESFTDCLLSGDPERLTEVLQNVMENAVKYGDGGSIRLSFGEEENFRLITVTNTGCTLPEEELDTIFDSFRRGSNAAGKEGSGLGLYICRRLMHDMGGEIFAEIRGGDMAMTVVAAKA